MSDVPVKAGPDWAALHAIPVKPKPLTKAIITRIAQEMLDETKPGEQLSNARRIAQDWIDKAASGSSEHLKTLLDRVEGKVPQPVNMDHGGNVGLTVNIRRIGNRVAERVEPETISAPVVDISGGRGEEGG